MKVGRLGEPSLPWGFAERCRAAGGAESGRDAAGVEGAALCLADGGIVFALGGAIFGLAGAEEIRGGFRRNWR